MADSTGPSAGPGPGGAAAGHGDLGRGMTQAQYQAFLASASMMNRITPPSAANVHPEQTHQQYPVGMIPAPVRMSMPSAPRPLYSTPIIVPPSQQLAPPPQYRAQFQTHQPPSLLAGHYQHQDYATYGGNTTSSTSPSLGFAGWRTYNALMSFGHQTPFGSSGGDNNNNNCNISVHSNGFQQNSSPYSISSIWPNNHTPMNQHYNINYVPAAATNGPALQASSFHHHSNTNQQQRNLGFATSFGATAPVVLTPAPPLELMSQRRTNRTPAPIFQEVKDLDGIGVLRASGPVEIEESDASEESDTAPVLEAQNQLGQDVVDINAKNNIVLNCKDYHTVLRKDLTNSDCGNIGRIVLPKRDAEANLPFLVDKDGMILEMDDLELPDVWKFKYRYWPNNKSRMYILETTGEFVKKHNLEVGDIFIIYQHKRTGRQVARAVKAKQLSSNLNLLQCQCMKEGNSSEECGFAVSPPIKKT